MAGLTAFDIAGLCGVATLLAAYALTIAGRIVATRPSALALNLIGPSLILVSLTHDYNLSAVLVEAAWAMIALAGLLRHALRRRP